MRRFEVDLSRRKVVIVIIDDFHDFVFVPHFDTKLSEHGWAPSCFIVLFEDSDDDIY